MEKRRMRKQVILATILALVMLMTVTITPAIAADDIDSITKGEVKYRAGHYLAGQVVPLGYDPYGYNYQAHMFSGSYFNVYSGGAGLPPWEGDDAAYLAANPGAVNHWAWPYREINLLMKWNDAWLSNKDRDQDGNLDRHWDYATYIGSGAWETNHMWGINPDGTTWNYFVKIVAVPADANEVEGIWYTADGVEIGSEIWGAFAIIQQVENDPWVGVHGAQYISPNNCGFGSYAP
jgi:hypothetical protein